MKRYFSALSIALLALAPLVAPTLSHGQVSGAEDTKKSLQAQAERHFAEAAAARIAAEGREQACQSATKQPGLGARIRGWLKRSSPTNR